MKSTKLLFTALLAFIMIKADAQTRVNGQILPGKKYPLELHAYDVAKNAYIKDRDLQLTKEGKFSFKLPQSPNMYKILLDGKGLTFINDGDSHIDIRINLKSDNPFQFQGSLASQQLLEYNKLVGRLQVELLYPLEGPMKKAMKQNDQELMASVESQYKTNLKLFVDSLAQKINSMGSSLAVYAIVIDLDFTKYLEPIEHVFYKKFAEERPELPFTKKLKELIEEAKQLKPGSIVYDLQLETLTDDIQSISKFNGENKIVLLDFWASWCLPCRKENREFVKILKKIDPNEFIIWSVSTDENVEAWKKAIEKDGIYWPQSRTTDEVIINKYQAVTLPKNYLIDTKGIIRAIDVKSDNLIEELNKIQANE